MTWELKQKLQTIVAAEQGTMVFAPGSRDRFAFVYPNTYHVGMSNLGLHVLYQQINTRGDTACERFFLPDIKTLHEYERTNTPLMSLETQHPLYEFPLIGFAVAFEMDYFNFLKILQLGKVPLLAAARAEHEPIVMIGGPCATFNPEPLAEFIDLAIIGEGEQVIHEVLDLYYQSRSQGATRSQILYRLAQLEGIYVPRFYKPLYNPDGTIKEMHCDAGVPKTIRRRWIKNLDDYPAHTAIITADTEFKDLFLIEIARGCGRHCRFCMAGYCFRKPRIRSLKTILASILQAKKYRNKVGLMGAAISDHPNIDQICEFVHQNNIGLSVASLRADSVTQALVSSLTASKHRTITLAPEAGSARLRRIINKGITEEHLYQAISLAVKEGIPNVRLYIMIGLPFETDEDIEAITAMALAVKKHMTVLGSKGKLTLSINPFIPKPFTPFQWEPMVKSGDLENKLKVIQRRLKTEANIEILAESPKESYIQAILARGDRRLTQSLLSSLENGVKGFKRHFKKYHDEDFYLYRYRADNEIFPWMHLSIGFDFEYLLQEKYKAHQEQYTPPCQEGCLRCGICKTI